MQAVLVLIRVCICKQTQSHWVAKLGTGSTKPLTALAIFPFKQLLCLKTVCHQTNALKIMQFDSVRLGTWFCSLCTEKFLVNMAINRRYLLSVSLISPPYKCTNPGLWNATTVLQIIVAVFILLSLKFVCFLPRSI